MKDTRVGIIGLGNMGRAVMERLIEKGFTIAAWNRTREKIPNIEGVNPLSSPKEVADNSEVVIVFVSDDIASKSVLLDENGVFRTTNREVIVINGTTVTPMHSLQVSMEAKNIGIKYIELPVLGGPPLARKGELIGIVGGDKEVYKKVEQIVSKYTKTTVYAGEIPNASVIKLAMNSIFFGTLEVLAESMALVVSWGIDVELLRKTGELTWTKALFDKYYDRIMAEQHPVGFKVRLTAKDLLYAVMSAYYKDTPMPSISAAAQNFIYAERSGYGEEDYTRAARFLLSKYL